MRRSTLVLTAVGVAAAAITGSAFTASNTFAAGQTQYAGYGSVSVTGVNVDHIKYNQLSGFADQMSTVVFTVDTPTTGALDGTHQQAELTLKNNSDVQIGSYTCTFGAATGGTPDTQDLTCDTASPDASGTANPLFANVKTVGLTVSNKS